MSSTPTSDTQQHAVGPLAKGASEASKPTIQPSSAQHTSTFPHNDPSNATEMQPNGYGMIHDNHIYGIYMDSDLGRQYAKLTTKEKKRGFLMSKGERRGEVMLDTRKRAPDVVHGVSASESK
jgi:hypothetical protein